MTLFTRYQDGNGIGVDAGGVAEVVSNGTNITLEIEKEICCSTAITRILGWICECFVSALTAITPRTFT